MRLCFGTFAQILLACGAERITKTKMVNTLVLQDANNRPLCSEAELSPKQLSFIVPFERFFEKLIIKIYKVPNFLLKFVN